MRPAHLKLLLATTLFGSYLVTGKLILREVPVFTAGFVRMVTAILFLGAFLWLTGRGAIARPLRGDRWVLVGQAFVGIFLFSTCAMYGVGMTGAIEAGVILGWCRSPSPW